MGITPTQAIREKLAATPALLVRYEFVLGEVWAGEWSKVMMATPTMEPAALMREKRGVVFRLTHSLFAQNLSNCVR